MESKKHTHFLNPTIIEAVIEVRFSKKLEANEFLKIENFFQQKYSVKKDEIVFYTASFQANGMSLSHDRPGQTRMKFNLGEMIFVQIFQDRFSFHWVGSYPGWDKFQNEFKKIWKPFFLELPNITASQIGVRFINKVDIKTDQQNVGFWLKKSPNYPQSVLSVNKEYFYSGKWPLSCEKWVQIFIAEAETKQDSRPLMLDIDVFQQVKKPVKLNSLSKIVSDLHEEVYTIFSTSLSANYKKHLNKKAKF